MREQLQDYSTVTVLHWFCLAYLVLISTVGGPSVTTLLCNWCSDEGPRTLTEHKAQKNKAENGTKREKATSPVNTTG